MALFDLTGKTVLVTGATSGIGRAVCRGVLEAGGAVVATGRDGKRLDGVFEDAVSEQFRPVVADLVAPAGREELVRELPSLDGIVHCAGALDLAPASFLSSKKLRALEAINYEAPVLLTTALFKAGKLNPGGSVVFVASVTGFSGAKGHVLYAGSKGALIAAGRSLAIELASKRIRVNSLAPGMVRSGMVEQAAAALGDEAMAAHEAEYPLGFGEPEDVAWPVVFLLSDASRWVTGTTLVCDGGFTAR